MLTLCQKHPMQMTLMIRMRGKMTEQCISWLKMLKIFSSRTCTIQGANLSLRLRLWAKSPNASLWKTSSAWSQLFVSMQLSIVFCIQTSVIGIKIVRITFNAECVPIWMHASNVASKEPCKTWHRDHLNRLAVVQEFHLVYFNSKMVQSLSRCKVRISEV